MANGGKREGAGRPKGSKNTRPRLADYLKPKDVTTFNEFVLSNYMESDKLTIWLGEQIYGKAMQAMEVTGADGKDLIPQPNDKIKELASALNEVYRRRTGAGS